MKTPDSADIVVIGAGICGSLLARKLALAGNSVLMLESGPRVGRAELVERYRHSAFKSDFMAPYPFSEMAPHPVFTPEANKYIEQTGPHAFQAQYIRMLGGTSWHWAAQMWRFLPSDFRTQTQYGVGKDWPISYDELEPYYYEAEVIAGVGGSPDTGSPRAKPFPMERVPASWYQQRITERLAPQFKVEDDCTARNSRSFDGRPACCGNNNCMPVCPIDAQYHGGLSAAAAEQAGVTIRTEAVVYRFEHDDKGAITAVHYYDWNKTSHRVTGKTFVLAANAIESAKLLLMSKSDQFPTGLANRSDQVGRNLCDHPAIGVTFDMDEPVWPGRGPVSPCSIGQFRDGEFRREHAPFRIDISNASQVASVTKEVIQAGYYGAKMEEIIMERAARRVSIKNALEQLPDPDNRVTLSAKKDALGLPTPSIYWNMDEYVIKGTAATRQRYDEIAAQLGATNIKHSKEGAFSNRQHITGTLSMGKDAASSVTDEYGRAHDHPNLFMAGTGVMPTVGTANVTLTAVALALRTADKILAEARHA
ncbi:GMC family oxidoreductase [Janthinobacterium aquaticum]|uniref:GMC family oxidoreductase n=1 Tax=Janthinobacterium sp. FT58W TaxID=2654254 RepID=UPI001264803C|nr:GMC family oxidoreductase [Janthinobacterium sp. FT58W]KAB8038488.1 NAD(P)-binding protein [Janthinobacterium sp. FT58W]